MSLHRVVLFLRAIDILNKLAVSSNYQSDNQLSIKFTNAIILRLLLSLLCNKSINSNNIEGRNMKDSDMSNYSSHVELKIKQVNIKKGECNFPS